jgi:nitroreductase
MEVHQDWSQDGGPIRPTQSKNAHEHGNQRRTTLFRIGPPYRAGALSLPNLRRDNPAVELDDFKSTSCAVQSPMLSMWSEGIGTKWTSGPVQFTQEFADLCGVDTTKERVAGCIWYGFASGGLVNADPKRRQKGRR